jgi:hypothetical protein
MPVANFTRTSDDLRGIGSDRSASAKTFFSRVIVLGSNAAICGLCDFARVRARGLHLHASSAI